MNIGLVEYNAYLHNTLTGKFVELAQDIGGIGFYMAFDLGRAVTGKQKIYCSNLLFSTVETTTLSWKSCLGHFILHTQNANFPV